MTELAYERGLRQWMEARGMRWERLRYARSAAGGDAVAYRLAPAATPRGVVLTVHGAGNDALFSLVGLAKRLLLRGWEVFAFDVDGHGRHSTTLFSAAAAAQAAGEAARRSGAAERGLPLHALGISLGGAVLLAALPTLSAASATLVAAPLRVRLSWGAILGELGMPLVRTLWREREHYGLTGLIPSFGPFKRATYPLRLAEPSPPGPFGYVQVLNGALEALRLADAARATPTPVLLVYARGDRLVPPEQGEALHRLLPRSELLMLPRESHLSAPLAPQAVRRMLAWMGTGDRGPGSTETAGKRPGAAPSGAAAEGSGNPGGGSWQRAPGGAADGREGER